MSDNIVLVGHIIYHSKELVVKDIEIVGGARSHRSTLKEEC
jgi:hypothetical protein